MSKAIGGQHIVITRMCFSTSLQSGCASVDGISGLIKYSQCYLFILLQPHSFLGHPVSGLLLVLIQ